ncbi:AIM24 family protein [Deinococcus cellulosilyticus]|uniref:Transcriptional regulator n=1 Tax=Deinococcus cellulosilyticus (strain DSM 18568 / NBRC 106333 / KACC 11606 / 5516J-15) TaxID=1223518 RepID=A0A511N0F9_DEIC1|nr:AIM24 family protein [Deinococcus cellulosilyticus]GEM46333.1 transcriptional regulator [Deinococcus cellulosilyticus NBRC 106333 = KACC 11606]
MSDRMKITDSRTHGNTCIELFEYSTLGGNANISTAQGLYYAEKLGMRLKRLKITLDGTDELITEAGALHFMKGDIQMSTPSGGGLGGFMKRAVQGVATGESITKPRYSGKGEIWLEPTFGHFLMVEISNDTLVADRGAFVCCTGGLEVGVARPDDIASGLLSGEGLFQTRISGTGIVVLQSPVPFEELEVIEMQNDTLKVDGNFAFARVGQFTMKIERSSRSLLGSVSSGEGLLQVFRGSGTIWIAPSSTAYDRMHAGVMAMGQK